jgi:hypothetical protein
MTGYSLTVKGRELFFFGLLSKQSRDGQSLAAESGPVVVHLAPCFLLRLESLEERAHLAEAIGRAESADGVDGLAA